MENEQSGTVQGNQGTGFSEDYVKQLREEAASWRTKFRELESSVKTKDIEIGLAKKGIKAKASWVEIKDGQSIDEAIDSFAKEFPHLAGPVENSKTTTKTNPEITQKSIQTQPVVKQITPPTNRVSNVEVKDLSQILANKSLNDVKQDPNSRAQIAEWYRSTLRSGR